MLKDNKRTTLESTIVTCTKSCTSLFHFSSLYSSYKKVVSQKQFEQVSCYSQKHCISNQTSSSRTYYSQSISIKSVGTNLTICVTKI
jgi:hypothetical protein